MTLRPKTKIAFVSVLGIFGFSSFGVALWFSHVFWSIVFLMASTLFASSSKFAKEVNYIKLYKELMGGFYNDYPQTEEQRLAVRPDIYLKFDESIRDLIDARKRYEANKIKYRGIHLGLAEQEVPHCEEVVSKFWRLLDHLDLIPSDPSDRGSWSGWEDFVESMSSDESILANLRAVCFNNSVFA